MTLVETLLSKKISLAQFGIVGDGPLRNRLQALIADQDFISYLGIIPNNHIPAQMAQYDLLILPSRYDGWNSVVNEALQAGIRVLCSETCGAATLLDGRERGALFHGQTPADWPGHLTTGALNPL